MSSQSGTTRQILECAKILRDRNQFVVTITAVPASPLARMSDEVISVRIGEDDSFAVKLESFASFNAIHFVLDCLYCFLLRLNFDRNAMENRKRAELVNQAKNTDFSRY